MAVFIGIMIFLVTVFMWPDTIYRMHGNLDLIRKMIGVLLGILLIMFITRYC